MLILNDLHIGVQRTGGTTPQSALALKNYLRESLRSLQPYDGNLTINGDLFDKFEVDTAEVIQTYDILAAWLAEDTDNHLNLVQGNHDANPRGAKISSFHLLAHFLQSRFGKQVRLFDKGFTNINTQLWCIPHVPNQDLFAVEVDKACKMKGKNKFLLLHCNVKNTFAEHSDHSLNLTDPMVTELMKAGWTLIVGHEHIGYELRGGRIIVVGNQFPSSVSDCIGDPDKFALRIVGTSTEYLKTWSAKNEHDGEIEYAEIDWRELGDSSAKFIRVVGDATAAEAADVVTAISRYRQRSGAFVITNGVKVDGVAAIEELTLDAVTNVRQFDVMSAILEQLDEKEQEVVKGLLNAD